MTAPRDPRTKADAIREPREGDRWQKGGGTAVLDGSGGFSWDGPAWAMPPLTPWHAPWMDAFRRWAKNAEFIGGANE